MERGHQASANVTHDVAIPANNKYISPMPALRNQRRELFVQAVVRGAKNGVNLTEAYKAAGYVGTGHVAEVGASRLMSSDEVRARIAELTAPAAKKAGLTLESLLVELETTIADARAAKQHSVVVQSLTLAAKLVGLLRDRVEIGGPGDFDQCNNIDEIARHFLGDAPVDEALALVDSMRDSLLKAASERALLVS
jgi:hypothetical protein